MIYNPIIGGKKLPLLSNPGTANDLLEGKQLIDQFGNPLTGVIPIKTESDLSVSGSNIVVPAGYYSSQSQKSVAIAAQATPTINVSSTGLITASSTQTEGYVSAGTKKATKQLTNRTASDVTVSANNITVPAGYYNAQVQKSVATTTQATPSISVSTGGLITASSTQSAGYTSGGTKSSTRQLTVQAGKTITPSTVQQTAVSSQRYTTGNIYVQGDPNLIGSNIKSGVSIFGVAGNYEGKEVIEYTYRDNITTTRESSKKLRINLPSSHPSSAELLHLWIMSTSRRNYISIIFFTRYGTMTGYSALDYIYFLVPTDNYYGNDVYTESSHSSSNTWLYMDGTSIIIDLNNTSGSSDISFYTSGMNVLDTSILFVK